MVKTRGIRGNVVNMQADAKMNREIQAKKVKAAGQLYIIAKSLKRKMTYKRAAQAMELDISSWDCVRKSAKKDEHVDMNTLMIRSEHMEQILKRLQDEDNKSELWIRQEKADKAAEMYCEALATSEPLTLKLAAIKCGLDCDVSSDIQSPDVQLVGQRVRKLKNMV